MSRAARLLVVSFLLLAAGAVPAAAADVPFIEITKQPGPSLPVSSSSASFEVTAVDLTPQRRPVTVRCALDGAALAPCAKQVTVTDLAEGPHTMLFEAAYSNGAAATKTATWTVDTIAPDTRLLNPPAAVTKLTRATFDVRAVDGEALYASRCSLDDPVLASCGPAKYYSDLAEGTHTFRAAAIDRAGNVDPTPIVHTWTIDTTSPTLTIVPGQGALSASKTASFALDTTDATAVTLACKLDTAPVDCGSNLMLTNLGEGAHTLAVSARDAAGNGASDSTSWTVDSVAPSISTAAPAEGVSLAVIPTLDFTTEPNALVRISIDGTEIAQRRAGDDGKLSYEPRALGEGRHVVTATAQDAAGNLGLASAERAFVLDTTADDAPGVAAPDGPTNRPSFALTGATGSSLECRVDGADFASCSSPYEPAGLRDGEHVVDVRQRDAAQNASPVTSQAFTVDATAPAAPTFDAGPPAVTQEAVVTARFSGEPGARSQCRIDDGAWTPCVSPLQLPGDIGDHRLDVRQVDRAGNTGAVASARWRRDAIPSAGAVASDTSSGTPQAPATPLTVKALSFAVAGKQRQILLDKRFIAIDVGCSGVPCAVTVTGRGVVRGRTVFRLPTVRATLPAGETRRLRIRTTVAMRRLLRKALRHRGVAGHVDFTIVGRGEGGGRVSRTARVRLRPLGR